MATPNKNSTLVAPKSGFTSPPFYLGLIVVVGTFVLGQYGGDLGSLAKNLPKFFSDQSGLVAGVIVIGLAALLIYVSSIFETRNIQKNGPKPNSPQAKASPKPFYETSEFWLGLVTVALNYLHDTGTFAPDVRPATTTTSLIIALVYTYTRARIKESYLAAQAADQQNK